MPQTAVLRTKRGNAYAGLSWVADQLVTAVTVTSNMTANVIGHHSGRWPVRYISVVSSKKALEATSLASQLRGSKALRTVFLESPACSLSCCSGADRGGNGRIWMVGFLLERGLRPVLADLG